ncbi:MAG: efflux RND transporter periplasmic adaptor subunit [Rhizomicrobium sp.]|nr:efflux RND transporter periplasmic adaptor subunit [Rhizomicrobium sp.]
MSCRDVLIGLVLAVILTACEKPHEGQWLGYAEGDVAYIAAPTAGWVTDLKVERGAWVKDGDRLFGLDDTNQTSSRDQAEAQIASTEGQIAQAEANLDLARRQLERQKGLLGSAATSRQAYDQAKSAYDAAVAQVAQLTASEAQARASLTGAAYQLSQRQVIAHTSGVVQDIYFRPGEYAPAQTPVIAILPPANVYVRFFVPENEFAHLRLGQKVKIHCDGCADNLVGTISFIASTQEFTPPVIFSNQSRSQLVFKVEARAPGGLKLHPGQPVDVDAL